MLADKKTVLFLTFSKIYFTTMKPVENKLRCPKCMRKSTRWMMQCDECDTWYHQSCVGYNEKQARELSGWVCNQCEQVKANRALADSLQHMFHSDVTSSTMREHHNTVIHGGAHDALSTNAVTNESSPVKIAIEGVDESNHRLSESEIDAKRLSLRNAERMMAQLEAEKIAIQKEIDDTMSQLTALSMKSRANESPRKPTLIRRHKSEGLPRFGSTSGKSRNDDEIQQKELKSQLISIQEQLKRFEEKQGQSQERPQYECDGAAVASVNTLNMSHWMARQTVGSLPQYDGKPGTWPGFYKTFLRTTEMCGFTDDENQERLRACLNGPALEMVESYLGTPNALQMIMRTLEQVFGRPEQTLHFILTKIRNEPPPRSDKPETFVRYAMAVRNVWGTMEEANMKVHMNNPQVLQELVDKLPLSLKFQWASHIIEMEEYDVATFAKWLDRVIQKTMLVVPSMDLYSVFENKSDKKRTTKSREYTYTHEMKSDDIKLCDVCDGECSTLSDCEKFLNAGYDEKWQIIRRLGVCRQCMKRHPIRSGPCKDWVKCTEKECKQRHHPAMHPRDEEKRHRVFNGTHMMRDDRPQFRYIPITLRNGEFCKHTYAFMDEGSSGTLMEEELAKCLNLTGTQTTLHVSYTADCSHSETSMTIESVDAAGAYEGARMFRLKNVRTVKKLGLAVQSLDYVREAAKYPYLKGLPVASYDKVRPSILIGLNNWNCALPTRIRYSSNEEPIAAKCMLGWTIFAGCAVSENQHVNYHKIDEEAESLHDCLKKWMSIDSLGVAMPQDDLPSHEDRRAVKLLRENTRKIDDRYETCLLWKHDEIELPESAQMALNRMRCLEARMKKDPAFGKAVRDQMREWIKLGYVRRLSQEELLIPRATIWYLPLFAVFNANKPGKTRLVLDAKAAVDGKSLNSVLLKGPDTNSNLFQVLLRFRQRKVGVSGDIRHMFQQIRIRDSDQHAQRIFWRDKFEKDPGVYVVQVMTFGATCSPATAQYVKDVNALEYRSE